MEPKLYWRIKKKDGKLTWKPAGTIYNEDGDLIVLLDAELEE